MQAAWNTVKNLALVFAVILIGEMLSPLRALDEWMRLRRAALMTVGVFGVVIVLGPAGLKLLFGGALCYAAARTTWAFLHA